MADVPQNKQGSAADPGKSRLPQTRASGLPVSEIVKDGDFKIPFVTGSIIVVGALFTGSPFAWVLAFGFFFLAVPGWILYLKNRESIEAAQLAQAQSFETEVHKGIRRALSKSQFLENLDEENVTRAQTQYDQALKRYKNFRAILDQKFDRGELTYDRYLGAGEQVFLGVMDNLQSVVGLFQNLTSIDSRHLLKRVQSLSDRNDLPEKEKRELEIVKDQLAVREKTLSDLIDRLQANEKALLELQRITSALNEIDTGRGQASRDLDQSVKDLEELAKRVSKYSKPR
jgi:methyl-accepting chemotaxis protein